MLNDLFNFKWCRAVSVVPIVKPAEPPPRPPKPKHVIVPWGKVPLLPKSLEQQTMEQEMMMLHYTYRKMEASQRHFHEESESVLRRQTIMVETLQFDNKVTQDKIDLFYPEDFVKEMKRLNAECSMYVEKIEAESQRVVELDEAVRTLYDDEYASKKTMGGAMAAREQSQATQIHIHILEKRVYKAMQDLGTIQWHNKLMQDEMHHLRVEHDLFEELHSKMEIELQECMDGMDEQINKAYELYDERHDYHKLISEILEMMEEDDAYTRWQQYSSWVGVDGRPLVESALQDEKERTERLKNKRPTLALTNEADLKKMFILEGTEERLKLHSKPHTRKYERLMEVKAFMNTQRLLGLRYPNVDDVLPMLKASKERHVQLIADVQTFQAENEQAMRKFADGDLQLDGTNDWCGLVNKLKRQIYLLFKEAGCSGWDEDMEANVQDERFLLDAIKKLFTHAEGFIVQLSKRVRPEPVAAAPKVEIEEPKVAAPENREDSSAEKQ